MTNVFDILKERGYVDQATFEDELKNKLSNESISFYVGFDATADSLTLGHFIQIMVMMHMQQAGHRPVALLGGGTTLVGDPSGRTEMRKIMTRETINYNAKKFDEQLSRFLDFSDDKAKIVNNADWLLDINFLDFMREVGVHFPINHMLSLDAYKNRINDGLTFFEFSYLLMQSYDYLQLFKQENCILQVGGSDQWSNILGGYDLIRKVEDEKVYAMTFNLLTTAAGTKMGKTEAGTIWLDAEKTPPYELYQYLRNVDDRDVEKFLAQLTFLPMDEVRELGSLEGAEINTSKARLAFEVTKLIHGEEIALEAQKASESLFKGDKDSDSIPFTEMNEDAFQEGIGLLTLLVDLEIATSNGEARRLIQQGGISINEVKIEDHNKVITLDDFSDSKLLIRKGRKFYHQIRI